jgi:hypothetical protein
MTHLMTSTAAAYTPESDANRLNRSPFETGIRALLYPDKPRRPRGFHKPEFHAPFRDIMGGLFERPEALELYELLRNFDRGTYHHSRHVMTEALDLAFEAGYDKKHGEKQA